MKRKGFPLYQYQISRNLYNQMLPKFDLLDNVFQNDCLSWEQVYEHRETITTLYFKMPEKTLVYGCIHLSEIRK